jgi:hypothetical protein
LNNEEASYKPWECLQEHAVKEGALFIVLLVAGQFHASDKIRIMVNNYTVESDEFVIHATAAGKPIDLLCDRDSPFCSPPKPGEYWMVDWTIPTIEYRGDYVCRDVDLFRIAANPERARKLGEYCLVEK